ncbi:nuclear transcription factor Y subunit A-4 [Cocos nucifera]|nr:nuclear transcription factor Y subunit A-4 [Cocos nucifera]
MQNPNNKDSEQSSVHSTASCLTNCPPWWNSSGPSMLQSSYSKNLCGNMCTIAQQSNQIKQPVHQLPNQDSSSTQSTGRSHQELSARMEENLHEQCASAHSGDNAISGKQVEGHMKPVLTLGAAEAVLPQKIDFSQSIACVPYPFADPYYGGILAAFGSLSLIHPQIAGMAPSAQIPLPRPVEDEPIYVNAKQYHGILRRRQLRAKLEARNKLSKGRKPYLHESRHLHAMKRARGSGGQFLNTKQLQQQSQTTTTNDNKNAAGSSLLQLGADGGGSLRRSEILHTHNGMMGATGSPTCSEITTVSTNGGLFQHQDHHLNFSTNFPPHVEESMKGGGSIIYGVSQEQVSVMR